MMSFTKLLCTIGLMCFPLANSVPNVKKAPEKDKITMYKPISMDLSSFNDWKKVINRSKKR